MAKIEDLVTSISDLHPNERLALLRTIRAKRRLRPDPATKKKKQPAKSKRKANKKNLRPQDAFGHINNMSETEKIKLIARLMGLDK